MLGGGDPHRQPRLGRYRLERRIGQGGMAEVFLARHEGPGGFEKQVVIKRIRPQLVKNETFVEMFLREGRLLAGLDHPNIVRVFELDEHNGEYFLALEYLDGLSLREVMERLWQAGLTVALEPLLQIFADAALGLGHAHALKEPGGIPANLVHRDVSPDNLFVTSLSVTKVLDFGIAKREGVDMLTQTGELKGKIPFMAPEALKGEALDARADLWSFGVTMFWALAGRRPFDGVTDVHTIKGILEDPAPTLRSLNPKVPQLVEDLILSCLEKDRGRRLKSAAALHDRLEALLVGLPRGYPPPGDLCAAARGLPPVDHEISPSVAAAAPSVPWPDRTVPAATGSSSSAPSSMFGGRGRNAVPLPPAPEEASTSRGAPTRVGRKFQSDLPQTDKKRPVGTARNGASDGEFGGATELVPASALHTTDEHRRAVQSTEHSAEGLLDKTGPQEVVQVDSEPPQGPTGFAPPSDPVIDVEREAQAPGSAVSPVAPTLPRLALEPPPGAPSPPPRPDIHSQATQAVVLPQEWPELDDLAIPAPRPSRAGPMAAGVVAALVLVAAVLALTGRLGPLADRLRGRSSSSSVDAGPSGSDGGAAALLVAVDAGALTVATDAGALAVATDAGAPSPLDAGPPALDAGAAAASERVLRVLGPDHVAWLGPTAEPLGVGRATLRVAPDTRVLFAKDKRRNVTTRIVLGATQDTVDYARLPKGKLTVRSRPNAEVFLGSERLGKTPLAAVSLVAGSYEVRLVHRKKSKTLPVDVRAGKTATLAHDFR